MPVSSMSYLWSAPEALRGFHTGISLHGHTSRSRETLDFLARPDHWTPTAKSLIARVEQRIEQHYGMSLDYAASFWRPPASPKMAYDLECEQIKLLGLDAMVSLTDHDTIEAPMLLRTMPELRHVPVSVEWSVPYGGQQSFHLGIHNLPCNQAKKWMDAFADYTANPTDKRLTELLVALNDEPEVLVVANHPLWDLYAIGEQRHEYLLGEFLQRYGARIHALELNGLRPWNENRAVYRLAEQWGMTLVAGGDRHGLEPNAAIHLTRATSFSEFVHEIRDERQSHIIFMPQYARPWKQRILESVVDTVRDYPEFPDGSRRWDERVYIPDISGAIRPLASYWHGEAAPLGVRLAFGVIQHLDCAAVQRGLGWAWSEARQFRLALNHMES